MEEIIFSKTNCAQGDDNHSNLKKRSLLKLEKLKGTDGATSDLNHTINKITENLEEKDPIMAKIQKIHDKMSDRTETKQGELPQKVFMERNSLLTDLAEIPHLRTLRSVFVVVLICLLVNAATKDLVKKGKITLGYQQFLEGLNNVHMAVFIWFCMFTSTVGVYGAFVVWGRVRIRLLDKLQSTLLNLWDTFWLSSFVVYCLGLLYFTVTAILANSLPIMASKIIISEIIRMLMKTYAFVRSNVPRVLKHTLHDDDKVLCPSFSKFLYFSFAPTLIYRDSYPRSAYIRWNYVASCCVQFVAASLCLHLIQEYVVVASFEEFDLKTISWKDMHLLIAGNGIPSMFYFLCWLFIICHASQNISAELLRFGDRMFYKDWWNSTSVDGILTDWNVIVSDWFYTYIYKDMYEVVLPRSTTAAKMVQYSLMMVFHELVYSFPYRFYIPVMFFVYIFGAPLLSSLPNQNYLFINSLLLYSLTHGMGILRTNLMVEYYVRIECPMENATLASYFWPRTNFCNYGEH